MGTALTREHVRILKGYAGQMVLVFDSDDAGINAAKRSIEIFVKEGIDTRILVLPENNDPDSYVMKHGKDAFLALANEAKTVMQFLLQLAMDTHGTTPEGRIKVLDEMKQHLALIRDSAQRSVYVRDLAETLNIDEKAVLEKVKDAYVRQSNKKAPLIPTVEEEKDPQLASDPREKQILAMMLHHPELIPTVIEKNVIQAFYSKQLQGIARLITQIPADKDNFITAVMAKVDSDRDQQLIASMAMEEFSGTQDLFKTANALIDRILKIKNKTDNLIISKLTRAEKGCNADVMELLKQKQQEIQQLHNS